MKAKAVRAENNVFVPVILLLCDNFKEYVTPALNCGCSLMRDASVQAARQLIMSILSRFKRVVGGLALAQRCLQTPRRH